MTKLKFPVIKGGAALPRALSMDEYFKFVQFNLKNAFDKTAYARWKKMLAVNTRFSIK